MTGILEQLLAEQQKTNQLLAAIANLGSGATLPPVTAGVANSAITSEMITELVTPHLSGPSEATARAKFKEVLAANGLEALSAATPDKYPALYAGFQAAIAAGFAAAAQPGII